MIHEKIPVKSFFIKDRIAVFNSFTKFICRFFNLEVVYKWHYVISVVFNEEGVFGSVSIGDIFVLDGDLFLEVFEIRHTNPKTYYIRTLKPITPNRLNIRSLVLLVDIEKRSNYSKYDIQRIFKK